MSKIICSVSLAFARHSSTQSSQVCRIIDGKALALGLRKQLKQTVKSWVSEGNRPPKLTAILVGDHPASQAYVNIKMKTAIRIGIDVDVMNLNADIPEYNLLQEISRLNKDPTTDGILVQLPLPSHISERLVCNAVSPTKDVDGFSEYNIGRLALNASAVVPCTALAVVHMIQSTGMDAAGKLAVVCGRSKNVGLPIALMLHSQQNGGVAGLNMTTAVCHRFTPHDQLEKLTQAADVIVSAAGVPGLVQQHMVKPGACVIDVGMTRVVDEDDKPTFVGDVDFDGVRKVAGWLSPVPGGVGPVTVAMLLQNTLRAAMSLQGSRDEKDASINLESMTLETIKQL